MIVRAVEFYAGIGGFACAASRVWPVGDIQITAIDIDQTARQVYERNHSHLMLTREITSVSVGELEQLGGDLWWMSPPCQPYSRRGHQGDTQDPRAASFIYLISQIERIRPRTIALENVAGFFQSMAYKLLISALQGSGYRVMVRMLCPTEMGWPNRRPRFYLLASLGPLRPWEPLPRYDHTVASLIQGIEIDYAQCAVDEAVVQRFSSGMDRVDVRQSHGVTACFGSSYGKSILHAGSYCRHGDTWRRFAPAEVARLLGFPASFVLPAHLSYRRLWHLLGNSLSIPAVETILRNLAPATN